MQWTFLAVLSFSGAQWGLNGTVNHGSVAQDLFSHLPRRIHEVKRLLNLLGRLVEALAQQPPTSNALRTIRRGWMLRQVPSNLFGEPINRIVLSCHVDPEVFKAAQLTVSSQRSRQFKDRG